MRVELKGEAREVVLAEAQSVLAMARDDEVRGRLGQLVAAAEEGTVDGDAAELLESVLELGLQAGRIRAYYGPGGEQERAGRWWWETNAPKECGIHCAVESGGLEHELHALIGETHE